MYSKKQSLDKFYTKVGVAQECLSLLNMKEYDLVIEPSAGNGSFLNCINHKNKIGMDIQPESNDIIQCDWFDYDIPDIYKNVLVVGNPPFGIRNKLSRSFLEHACSFNNVKTIAFILPDVYNKHTHQKYVSKSYRIKCIHKLQKNSFLIGDEEYSVPCSFFIFDKSNGKCLRFNPDQYKETDDWKYGTKNEYDFFVMGAAPNTVKDTPEPNNRGYYIKVKKDKHKIMNNFINGVWNGYSSANGGVAWLTKPELVKMYSEQFTH